MLEEKIVVVFGGTGLIGGTLIKSRILNNKYRLINFDLSIKKIH